MSAPFICLIWPKTSLTLSPTPQIQIPTYQQRLSSQCRSRIQLFLTITTNFTSRSSIAWISAVTSQVISTAARMIHFNEMFSSHLSVQANILTGRVFIYKLWLVFLDDEHNTCLKERCENNFTIISSAQWPLPLIDHCQGLDQAGRY